MSTIGIKSLFCVLLHDIHKFGKMKTENSFGLSKQEFDLFHSSATAFLSSPSVHCDFSRKKSEPSFSFNPQQLERFYDSLFCDEIPETSRRFGHLGHGGFGEICIVELENIVSLRFPASFILYGLFVQSRQGKSYSTLLEITLKHQIAFPFGYLIAIQTLQVAVGKHFYLLFFT